MNKEQVVFILISIVFLIVFGGVVSILPSRRARQIGNLRIAARKYDLEISLVQIADVNASLADRVSAGGIQRDPKKRCVAWSKRFPDEFTALPEWISYVLDKDESRKTTWQLDITKEPIGHLTDTYWTEVDRIKELLPNRCIALECTDTEIRWLGYEEINSTTDEFIHRMVQSLDALIQLNVSISNKVTTLERLTDSTAYPD